jgi:hypothetical protein
MSVSTVLINPTLTVIPCTFDGADVIVLRVQHPDLDTEPVDFWLSKAAAEVAGVSLWQAYKNTQPHDLHVSTPVATAGTVKIEVSPNGSTWTTLEAARTIAASGGPNIDSTLRSGWSLRLTATTSVLGTSIVH